MNEIENNENVQQEQPQIIRCGDCMYYIVLTEEIGRCALHENHYHDPNWYCSEGKPKEQ